MPTSADSGTDPDPSNDATAVLPTGSGSTTDPSPTVDVPPTTIGRRISRYVVLDTIGHGAMGEVLRAYDPKLGREVALKLLRSHAWLAESRARMVREAQAMAKVTHPNVVGVYDVETEVSAVDGGIVLVMEYVPSQSLAEWLAAETRPWTEIVETFRHAGTGLAAAHAEGILHRDFKPANVLVARDGRVKVTDFGLAKPVGSADSSAASTPTDHEVDHEASTELTTAGTVMGTPRYMAPEQHRGESLTPAADLFSFCVALWEALSGEPAFPSPEPGLDALLRRKARGPGKWNGPRSIPGRIVDALSRGLAPSPADRWASMNELLDVLDPSPPRAARNAAVVSVAGALLAAGIWWSARPADEDQACTGAADHIAPIWNDQRETALKQRFVEVGSSIGDSAFEVVSRELDAYASGWTEMHTEACRATTILGEQSADVMDLRMTCLDRAQVALRATVDVLADADPETVRRADRVVDDLPDLSRCADVETLRASIAPPPAEEAEAVERAREHLAIARARRLAGDVEAARAAWDDAEGSAAGLSYEPLATELALEHGRLLSDLGDYDASEAALREALRSAHHHGQWSEAGLAATQLMSVVGHRKARGEAGLRYRDIALGLAGDDPQRQWQVRHATAIIYSDMGNLDRAEEEARATLRLSIEAQADSRARAQVHNLLAMISLGRGEPAGAEMELRESLEVLVGTLGPEHPDASFARVNLASALWSLGKLEAAEEELTSAVADLEASLGEEHPKVAAARDNLGNVLFARGKYADAERLQRRALAVNEAALGAEHPRVATTLTNLATSLHLLGRTDEAIEATQRALGILEAVHGPEHPDVALSLNNLASMLEDSGDLAAAEATYRRALELRTRALGEDHPDVAFSRSVLAGVLVSQGRAAEAVPLAERAVARLERSDVDVVNRAKASLVLARALWDGRGDRARAHELAMAAAGVFEGMAEARPDELAEVRAWLDAHPAP